MTVGVALVLINAISDSTAAINDQLEDISYKLDEILNALDSGGRSECDYFISLPFHSEPQAHIVLPLQAYRRLYPLEP